MREAMSIANNPDARIKMSSAKYSGLCFSGAARKLGLSEAELVASRCGADAVRLQGDLRDLIREFPRLGRVSCTTRNDAITHERTGCFQQVQFVEDLGLVFGPEIDLRMFMQHWKTAFAVMEKRPHRTLASFQFFDAFGHAVHKVVLQNGSDMEVFHHLVERFADVDQSSVQSVSTQAPILEVPDGEIAVDDFRDAWMGLEDTVYFADILKKFRLRREQALRLAPPGFARKTEVQTIQQVLASVASTGLRIMIFVRSSGFLQIHTGAIHALRASEQRLRVLDPQFDLHITLPLVAGAWVVRKPTIDGEITSLELFDQRGENIALLFGKRGSGMPEDRNWRSLLRSL